MLLTNDVELAKHALDLGQSAQPAQAWSLSLVLFSFSWAEAASSCRSCHLRLPKVLARLDH